MRNNPFHDIFRSKEYSKVNESSEFPFIIDVELTNHCNLNCKMCSRQIMTRDKKYMSRETFDKILKECKRYNTPIRFIRWGEPFMHWRILNFCDKVKEAGLLLHITTNGLLLREYHMQYLIDIKLDSIIFSMQGLTKEEYEEYRGTFYDLLETNIKKFIELRGNREKPFIHITCTANELGNKENSKFLDKWSRIVDEVTVGKTNWARLNDTVSSKYINCNEPWHKLSIDWDGKVSACCGDYDNLLTIGDINETSLFNIWNYNSILDGIRTLLANDMNRSLTLCNKCYPAYGNFNNKSNYQKKR